MAAFKEEVKGFLEVGGFREISRSDGARFHASREVPHVVVSVGGIGQQRAQEAVTATVSRFNPHLVVSAGFGAGSRDGQSTGDVVICDRLTAVEGPPYSWSNGDRLEIEANRSIVSDVEDAIKLPSRSVEVGSCLTVPQFVSRSSMKRWIGDTFDVATIDMESYWVASAASEHRVPWLPVRVVLDPVDQNVSNLVGELLNAGPMRRVLRSTRFLAGNPGDSVGVMKIILQVKTARAALSDLLTKLSHSGMGVGAG